MINYILTRNYNQEERYEISLMILHKPLIKTNFQDVQ